MPGHLDQRNAFQDPWTRHTGPTTNQLMQKVLCTIHTEDKTDKIRTHHHQDIEDPAYRTYVAVPPPFPKLPKKRVRKGELLGNWPSPQN